MKPILIFFFALLSIFLLGVATAAVPQAPSRDQIYFALLKDGILDPNRELVHLSNTCVLHIDGDSYPVVDIQELVKSNTSPEGINQIIVLNPLLKPVQEIEYTTQRPLFCVTNQLYVFGDLAIGNSLPEGNILTFSKGGKSVALSHVEANRYPIPITSKRKLPPQ